MHKAQIVRSEDLPNDAIWLGSQSGPVIAYGVTGGASITDIPATDIPADVVVPDLDAALALEQRIQSFPIAAMVLVQVLRSTASLPLAQALDLESMAYSTLQAGPEFAAWNENRKRDVAPVMDEGEPIILTRNGSSVEVVLNRAGTRNAISVEMRDALVEALQLLEEDPSIETLHFSAKGACFSVGGELREFGLAPDPAVAHWVRTVQSPARLLAKWGGRVSCHVHGACIGSGLELPAFAAHVVADKKTFFQLPELQLGLIPGAGGTVSLSRRIGRQRTAWMVLSGKRINAQTALAWGLVDEIVS